MFTRTREPSRIRRHLRHLHRRLQKEFCGVVKTLRARARHPELVDACYPALIQVSRAQNTVADFLERGKSPIRDEVDDGLRRLEDEIISILQKVPRDRCQVRAALVRTLNWVAETQASIEVADVAPTGREVKRRVVVATELIMQAYQSLFPPERMIVASGRTAQGTTRLSTLFEVTGEHNAARVRAEPALLARALISMEQSDSHLAAWLHSHPGQGREATRPSSIDVQQHDDWLRNYTPFLLSAIFVADGWIRFWGTAIEVGKLNLEIVGPGLLRKAEDEQLYRIKLD